MYTYRNTHFMYVGIRRPEADEKGCKAILLHTRIECEQRRILQGTFANGKPKINKSNGMNEKRMKKILFSFRPTFDIFISLNIFLCCSVCAAAFWKKKSKTFHDFHLEKEKRRIFLSYFWVWIIS